MNSGILHVDMPVALENTELWKTDAFIDGAWVAAHSNHRFKVTNPATGSVIAEVADLGAREAHQAVDAAARAFTAWRETSAHDCAACLRRWADEIIRNREDLARILSAEVGRSLVEHTLSLRRKDHTGLRPGLTIHFMPGLHFGDWGFQITESIPVTETGHECFARVPREAMVID